MDIQRLRNLTTGRLHTDIGHVYEDIEYITGAAGVMTHMLPRAMRAMEPYLRRNVSDPRMWEDKYDPSHEGQMDLAPMSEADRHEFWALYVAQPDPLADKDVVTVRV